MTQALLDPDRVTLVVVDVQEAFRAAVLDFEQVAANTAVLVEAAGIIGIPVLATEQYPRGLGATVPEVADHLNGSKPIEKTVFSAARADGFDLDGRDQVLMCGIETHVCVWQTAHDLLEREVVVQVAGDAVSSRTAENRAVGLHRMEDAGAIVTSVETALFEMLGEAGGEQFKSVQRLIK
jgi:nicotinamidase-related amidase